MDAHTFADSMGNTIPFGRYQALLPAWNAALVQAGATTVNRVAMLTAQVGHESVGLKYMAEIASGAAYEGRRDLGNTQPGDGRRFKGHGPIQITGRANHAAVSRWAHGKGYVPTPTFFVDQPAALGDDRYGFLGVVWYWTVARSRLNAMADAGDLLGCTRAVNGGTNGLADRRRRWNLARTFGDRLLPDQEDEDMTPEQARKLDEVHKALTAPVRPWLGGLSDREPGKPEDPATAPYTALQYELRNNVEIRQLRKTVDGLIARLDALTKR